MLKGSILQELTEAHQAKKTPLNLGVYYKNTLVALCHALEDFILSAGSSPIMVTAFQRGKWYLQEADRYGDIAKVARQVVIMASADAGFTEHPTSQLDNVGLVDLDPEDPVAQEWHLIILSPTYQAMVLCQELSDADYGVAGVPKTDIERKFYGLWTFEADLVVETVNLAIEHIEKRDSSLAATLKAQVADIAKTEVAQPDAIDEVVCKVVDYLQTSQTKLKQSSSELDRNLVSNELQAFFRMSQLMDAADLSNPMAGAEVSSLAEAMGQLLELPAWRVKRLRLAGLLHRFGDLPSSENLDLDNSVKCRVVAANQALRIMPQMEAVARILAHETEWWNGSGLPKGLKEEEIPLESRILGLAIAFQKELTQAKKAGMDDNSSLAQALSVCQQGSGDRFSPQLVDILTLLVAGMQQGLSLSVIPPKLTSGLWLLEETPNEVKSQKSEVGAQSLAPVQE
jgi:DICT domain-containing protein